MNNVTENDFTSTTHQGKTIAQWEKDFNGEFSAAQLLRLARGGMDLQKLLLQQNGVLTYDEADKSDIDDKELFKGEQFFFETIDENVDSPSDIVTVDDLVEVLTKNCDNDDRITFRFDKQQYVPVKIESNGGITVIDFVKGETVNEAEHCWRRPGCNASDQQKVNNWLRIDQIDPNAKDAAISPGWRCGKSTSQFIDLLYPERKYKVGTMVMRNKYIKAGSMSGEKCIAIPSYFDAIKNNDEDAINLLKLLGIPLDLTFKMDPNGDYTSTYVIN